MQALRDELARAGATEREAAELAALLQRAAEPARFDVPRADIEAALARTRPQPRAPRRIPRVALALPAIALAVLALVLVLPSRQESVQARALDALGDENTVLHMNESIYARLPGTGGTTTRDVWFDATRNRARWTDFGFGGYLIADTLVTPKRFDRVLPTQRIHLYGSSCRAIADGCAQLLDPVARYREVLRRATVEPVRTTYGGRATYRFELRLERGLDQLVYVDRETLLPRTILWRERDDSGVHVVSTIDFTDVERVDRDDVPKRIFARPTGGRLVELVPAGKLVDTARLRRNQVRDAYWLGPRGLHGFVWRRYEHGSVVVARYADLEVWTYGRAVPRDLLAQRVASVKTVDVGGRPASFVPLDGRVALVRDGNPSVAVTAVATKEALFEALKRVRRLP